ncbi:PAS domain-containing sensor histidine kinase [Adhaeribacter aquaticus]|uniref:sensor histidine kinase n=1 Tax=Adhaeribacter aquaticus TaxID=299567 RepID=UPI000412D6AB|nr:ATP-binding protein [Adhaeribacter aquaticus]
MLKNSWHQFTEILLEQFSEPVVLFDNYLKIVAINEKGIKILQLPPEQIFNRAVDSVFPGLLPLPLTHEAISSFNQIIYKSYYLQVSPFIGVDDKLLGGSISFIYRKEDSKKRISKTPLNFPVSLADLDINQVLIAHLVNYNSDGVIIFDQEGRITLINRFLEEEFKVESSKIKAKSLTDFAEKINSEVLLSKLEEVLSGQHHEQINFELPFENKTYAVILHLIKDKINTGAGGVAIFKKLSSGNLENTDLRRKKIAKRKARLAIWVTQIEERKRIAEKIHNSLGQILFGLKMEFQRHEVNLEPGIKETITEIIEEAISETKTLAFELMPAMLEDFGLIAALEELVKKCSSSTLKITLQVDDYASKLDEKLQILIFSVVQEFFNNIVKHARATKASLSLKASDKAVTLKILDNGVGFEKGEIVFASKSTGLRNIKNSLKLFGGDLKISSQVGKGTLIKVELPINYFTG